MLLALETATDACSVALADLSGEAVVTAEALRPRQHAAWLVPLVQDVLARGGCDPSDLRAVAVSSGPGSYTGLRIGVSTAKGLAFATGASLVGVPTLDALAFPASSLLGEDDRLLVALPSRRGEVYVGVYQCEGEGVRPVTEPAALRLEDLNGWLPPLPGTLYLAGPAAPDLPPHLGTDTHTLGPLLVRPRAEAVAVLGARRLAEGHLDDLAAFEPAYLTDFVVRPGRSIFERLPS